VRYYIITIEEYILRKKEDNLNDLDLGKDRKYKKMLIPYLYIQ